MFRFEHSEYFYLFLLLPLLIWMAIAVIRRQRSYSESIGDQRLLKMVLPGYSIKRQRSKMVLFIVGLVFFILALVNPQLGTKKESVRKKSADIMIAVDISRSMLAEDIKPSRLDVAKRFTVELIETLKQERIGLILFAANAYLQMPLTQDYAAAQIYARAINTDAAGTQGTSLKDAIDLALEATNIRDKRNSVLIIISDGEDHEEGIEASLEAAIDIGLAIYTVGVGTAAGGYIPIQAGQRSDYLRDENGRLVRTTFNDALLRSIANQSKGKYYAISERNILGEINDEIDKLDKVALEQRSFSEYESYYTYFLVIGTILWSLIYILPNNVSDL